MGSCFSKSDKLDEKETGLSNFHSQQTHAGIAKDLLFTPLHTPQQAAREIEKCSDLLHRMYTLDLQIWGMESLVDNEDIRSREAMKRRADALFAEIRRMIQSWKGSMSFAWTEEEQEQVDEICEFMARHGARRY